MYVAVNGENTESVRRVLEKRQYVFALLEERSISYLEAFQLVFVDGNQ